MSTKSPTNPTASPTAANPNPNPDIDADRERQRRLRDQTQRGKDGTSVYVPGCARSTRPDTPTPLAPFPGTRTAVLDPAAVTWLAPVEPYPHSRLVRLRHGTMVAGKNNYQNF